jgi:hypothetical protein
MIAGRAQDNDGLTGKMNCSTYAKLGRFYKNKQMLLQQQNSLAF